MPKATLSTSILRLPTLENFGGHGTAEDLHWFARVSFIPADVECFAMEWRSDKYKNSYWFYPPSLLISHRAHEFQYT
jgi:hypothetical protein